MQSSSTSSAPVSSIIPTPSISSTPSLPPSASTPSAHSVASAPLATIEDVEEFYQAINRSHLTKSISESRPYTYWTIELYDQKNGIRGGGGLGVLAADTRRTAARMNVPFTLITPFYPSQPHQQIDQHGAITETHQSVNYREHGFSFIDTVNIRVPDGLATLDVIQKIIGSTRILSITEPGFGELYSGESGGDHRLYQEVALGFGGYQALKLVGLKPAIMQLNEVATFFAALARLDELASNGMDFYEAVVYTRKHTLYTNHTLVQAAEAEFSYQQFERFVFPNLKSMAVRKWLSDKFDHGRIKLSTVTVEIAELRSGVSKLHARVANYRDLAGARVKFKAITNGIDIPAWTAHSTIKFLEERGIIDKFYLPTPDFAANIESITAADIRALKSSARAELNQVLSIRKNQYGVSPDIPPSALIFEFKRRFVDYKRPALPFTDKERLKEILVENDAYYILAGRVHSGDTVMSGIMKNLLETIDSDPVLKTRVHYLSDYDEQLGRALSLGANISINTPIVGLEACGTSWMKDIINFGLLISTHDGGVADAAADNYLSISGSSTAQEVKSLYARMAEAAAAWYSDFDLEYLVKKQLTAYLHTISGTRMLKDYLDYLF